MSICWYCYWGWAKPVADIFKEAVDRLRGDDSPLLYGPAHAVWYAENWDSVDWCIAHFDEHKGDNSEEDLAVVMWSLNELQKLPLQQREIAPPDYDGANPENFPPPVGVVVVKV